MRPVVTCLLALVLGLCAVTPGVAQTTADPAALRLLAEAQRLAAEGNINGALREYELLVRRFPQSPQAQEALLAVARTRLAQNEIQAAREAAQVLTQSFPESPFTAGAYLLLADTLAASPATPGDLAEARATLRRVPLLFGTEAFPNLPARVEARVRAGEISLRLGEDDDAAAAFVAAIEDEPPSPWTSRARLGLARVLLEQRDWVAAADVLQRIVDADPAEQAPGAADLARRRLTLIHRLLVRPEAGEPSWGQGRVLTLPGVLLKRPAGLAVREDGSLLVVDTGNDAALVLDPDGALLRRVALNETPGSPWWQGTVGYLPIENKVQTLPERSTQSFLVPGRNRNEPIKDISAGSRGLFGQWYLLSRDARRVHAFVPTGKHLAELTQGDPMDMAQDQRGRLYVLDRKARTVVRFTANGTSEGSVVSGGWRRPEALALDLLGNLYVLDRDQARIEVFDPEGQQIGTLGPQLGGGLQLRNPVDLGIDGAGRVFIADSKLPAIVVVE